MATGKFQGAIVPTTPTGCAHQSSPVRLNLSNKLCSNFPLRAPELLECHPNDFDAFSIRQEKGIIVHPLVYYCSTLTCFNTKILFSRYGEGMISP
jgi:hypothetical protein